MSQTSLQIAENYYKAMNDKDINKIASYLHPNVKFIGPLATLDGRETVVQALAGFLTVFKSLKICSKFGERDQAMLVYELECLAPIGGGRVAGLITIKDKLISNIELFFDTSLISNIRK
jgi:hypothetical protein